jgi:prolyl 4-hydroxylase
MKRVDYDKEIFVIENFISQKECEKLIEQSEAIGYEEAKVDAGGGKQMILKGVRNNDRILYTNQILADELWQKAKPFLPPTIGRYSSIGLNELFRFYKYSPGQRFKMHIDGSYQRNEIECSFYTFLLYLNDDFEGGETEFQNICMVNPKQGSLLVFYHPLKHEGKVLISGKKYCLRSDVMYKLNET